MHYLVLGFRILQDPNVPKQASINAFYVIAFLRCRSQRLQFNVSERGRSLILRLRATHGCAVQWHYVLFYALPTATLQVNRGPYDIATRARLPHV